MRISRLDQRFRLSDDVWKALPRYDDWGFAVFRFRRSSGVLHVHPMALEFPRRDPEQLFFPLVHLHDGRVDEWADLDHRLYCQDVSADRLNRWPPADHWGWETSDRPLAKLVDLERSAGVLGIDRPCHRVQVRGTYPNVDLLV